MLFYYFMLLTEILSRKENEGTTITLFTYLQFVNSNVEKMRFCKTANSTLEIEKESY